MKPNPMQKRISTAQSEKLVQTAAIYFNAKKHYPYIYKHTSKSKNNVKVYNFTAVYFPGLAPKKQVAR